MNRVFIILSEILKIFCPTYPLILSIYYPPDSIATGINYHLSTTCNRMSPNICKTEQSGEWFDPICYYNSTRHNLSNRVEIINWGSPLIHCHIIPKTNAVNINY